MDIISSGNNNDNDDGNGNGNGNGSGEVVVIFTTEDRKIYRYYVMEGRI